MPFNLSNAPSTFQPLIERCLGEFNFDIIIFSKTFKHLDQVFSRLAQYGLKLKSSKCYMMTQKIQYLGHIVKAGGIPTQPRYKLFRTGPLHELSLACLHRLHHVILSVYRQKPTGSEGHPGPSPGWPRERVIAYANWSLQPTGKNPHNYSSFKLVTCLSLGHHRVVSGVSHRS